MKYLSSLLAFSVVTLNLGCGRQSMDRQLEAQTLMQTSRDWSKAAASHDVEKTLSYWADDAVVISPRQPLLEGKARIRQMVEGSFKTPDFEISWEPLTWHLSDDGSMGWLREKSKIVYVDSTGRAIREYFNVVTVWKRQIDGAWKNVADISANE